MCIALAGVLLAALPHPAVGMQTVPTESDVVEAVWAVVGDSVILKTEVDQYLLRLSAQGVVIPQDPDQLHQLREQAIEQLINEQLILQEAYADTTLAITDEDLDERVQQEVDAQVRQFGTLGQLRVELARQDMTLAGFREQQRALIHRRLLLQSYLAKRQRDASAVAVSEQELRDFFAENQAQVPTVAPSLRFVQYLMQPIASDTAKASALAEAERVLDMIREGEDFADLATRFSQGPSREVGGALDWIRRDGSLVKNFEDAVFSLPAGAVSAPTETEFGYHLIMVERVRGGERRVRHILFTPTVTPADIAANRARAEEAIALLTAGESMTDTVSVKVDTINIDIAQLTQLSAEHASALREAEVGAVIGPIPFQQASINALAIVKVLERRVGGRASFEDMRAQMESRLREDKIIEQVVQDLRAAAYVDIRLPGGS
ncbi:MAG: peptidylprolyl isomerase [Gemmatimonadetes bacterium]|nr:peptidylprolyl isomerase [Gemmatimonadota bacterium]